MTKTQLKEQRVDKLEKLFEELSSKPAGIPLEKERMIMIGGGVEHNPVSYTLFYEAKTEEAENYSQIFVSNSCAHCQMGC